MVRTLELRATQEGGVIWPSRPLISARGLLSSIHNLPLTSYDKAQRTRFRAVTFNSTGEILAAVDEKGRVFVFFITSNKYALVQHLGVPTIACCFSPTRRTELLVTCENETACCIDVQSQVLISTLRGHRFPAKSASFQRSGQLALTASQDAVILWDTKDWSRFRVLNAGPGVEAATFVARGDLVAVCFQDDTIMMWELESLALRYRYSVPEHEPSPRLRNIAVSEDYKMLVASGRCPFIYVWDFESQTIIRIIELPAPIKEVISHAFVPDHESTISILEGNGSLFFLDVGVKKPKIQLEISHRGKPFTAVDIECHGRYVAASSNDGYLLLYDMEIARDTASRAQSERKKEGLFDLDEDARLQTRSGLIGPNHSSKPTATSSSHPVPSKLIDSLFGATYSRRNDQSSAQGKMEGEVKRGAPGDKEYAASPRTRQPNNDLPSRGYETASPYERAPASSTVARKSMNPLAVPPAMLNPEEIAVNRRRLEASLKCNGMYPKKYRLLVWRFLLRLPKNEEAFRTLVMKGKHPAFVQLHEQYPLQNSRLFRRLHRALSAIAYWCPAFGEVSYLPEVVYPFVKLFRENDLAAFEASVSVLLHWCGDFLRSLPYPPVVILTAIEKQLVKCDPQLHEHMVQHQVSIEVYGWSLLKTVFTEVLSEDEWMRLWDYLLTYAERPQLLCVAVLAYLLYYRTALLSASDRFSIEQFFHQQNAINIQSFIQLMLNISEQIDLTAFTEKGTGDAQMDKERGGGSVGASYWPLPSSQYPAFASYPKFVIDFQISERNRIALEENEMVQKKKLLQDVEEQCAKLKAEHESWLKRKNLVLAAEEKRRKEAIEAEKLRILNLKSLDHQTRARRLERLDAMEKYAHETLDETAKMFHAEYERLESTLAMQRERMDFEILSRQQEEKLQRIEFETEKRVMDIHKQTEMEERLQKLRTEFVTRVKQQELEDLLKFERWKREDDDRKRDVKMKLQRREELAVLHQEKTIRQKLETQLLDQLVEKEKELLALETERKSRRKEQRAFDALDHEIDMRKAELDAMRGHQRGYEQDTVHERVASSGEEDDRDDEGEYYHVAARHTRVEERQPPPPFQGLGERGEVSGERKRVKLPPQEQNRWDDPEEQPIRSSMTAQRRERQSTESTAARSSDQDRASAAEKVAQLNRSLMHSASSSESSFTSAILERTMEEMALLEKALRNISSSSSSEDNSSHASSRSSISQTRKHAQNLHDQQQHQQRVVSPRSRVESAESSKHFRFQDGEVQRPTTNTSTQESPAASMQRQHTAHASPAAVHEKRDESVAESHEHEDGEGYDTEGSSSKANVVQRPIEDLERELGILFDDFSEEEKEGDSDDEDDSEDEEHDAAMDDDRARLLLRAKKLLEEEDFSSSDDDDELAKDDVQ